jgi:hypothetical protein
MKHMASESILLSHEEFFREAVRDALNTRRIAAPVMAEQYLVELLEHYVVAERLHDVETVNEEGQRVPQTLAETLLTAIQSNRATKIELLKRLADRTLYTCGFFGDSYQRKVIDIDYCFDIAGTAYRLLAESSRDNSIAEVYDIYSKRFNEFVDVLSYISEKSQIQSTTNVLRIYDRYLKTGSDLAREKLSDLGIVPISKSDQKKVSQF